MWGDLPERRSAEESSSSPAHHAEFDSIPTHGQTNTCGLDHGHPPDSAPVDPHPSPDERDGVGRPSPARDRLGRNRRFRWMQSQLAQGHAYFSTQAMRQRQPGLFEQICGADSASWPRPEASQGTDGRLSSLILDHWDRECARAREPAGNPVEEEFDSEDEDGDASANTPGDPDERARLTAEFRQLMCQRFLNGDDLDFDYAALDHDPAWDDWDQLDRDAEEAYFDAD